MKKSACLCLMLVAINFSSVSTAQVAPLEVNQKAIDDFGIDRKTGRFVWETGALISVGGSDGLAVSFTSGIFGASLSPAMWPTLTSIYDSSIAQWNRTVEYFGGVITFTGTTSYASEYTSGASLENTTDGFIFTDAQGVRLRFKGNRIDSILFPDGRQLLYGDQYVRDNRGYMIKMNSGIYAVNQSVDYCMPDSSTVCGSLYSERRAFITRSTLGEYIFTNASGEVTKLRGTLISAKKWNRDSFHNPPDEYIYYPLGVTGPGRQVEDISITYRSIDPNYQTHDDIWVTSIQKDGITASYTVTKTLVGSQSQYTPSTSYLLDIKQYISGQQIYESFTVKPSSGYGRSRRTLAWIQDGLGRRTGFLYNPSVELSGVNLPDGRTMQSDYDSRNNVIRTISQAKSGGAPDLTTTFVFPISCAPASQAICNLPLTMTDPNGNVTEYAYNSMGQVVSETKPPATTGGVRPQTISTYTMRTAYIKDASGAAVAAGAPISLLTRLATCRTQSLCSGTSDEVATTYDYGPVTGLNNLNLKGIGVTAANGQGALETHWTCFQYNYFGEKIAETQPIADLTSCP